MTQNNQRLPLKRVSFREYPALFSLATLCYLFIAILSEKSRKNIIQNISDLCIFCELKKTHTHNDLSKSEGIEYISPWKTFLNISLWEFEKEKRKLGSDVTILFFLPV